MKHKTHSDIFIPSIYKCGQKRQKHKNNLFPPFLAYASATFLFLPPTAIDNMVFIRQTVKNRVKLISFLTACCDKISYSTALKKGAVLNRWKQQLWKCLHFSKTKSHDCSLHTCRKPNQMHKNYFSFSFFCPSANLLITKSFKLTFVLFPISRPSTKPVPFGCHSLILHKNRKKGNNNKVHIQYRKPAAMATTFFKVPHSSTPSTSWACFSIEYKNCKYQ